MAFSVETFLVDTRMESEYPMSKEKSPWALSKSRNPPAVMFVQLSTTIPDVVSSSLMCQPPRSHGELPELWTSIQSLEEWYTSVTVTLLRSQSGMVPDPEVNRGPVGPSSSSSEVSQSAFIRPVSYERTGVNTINNDRKIGSILCWPRLGMVLGGGLGLSDFYFLRQVLSFRGPPGRGVPY